MAGFQVRVHGLRETRSALKRYDKETSKVLDVGLREAAKIVRDKAAEMFSPISTRTAGGFRPRLRGFGKVVVEQRLGKTTGTRPDFGSLQMRRALLPALEDTQDQVVEKVEEVFDLLGLREGF